MWYNFSSTTRKLEQIFIVHEMWNYWSFVKYIFPIFKLFENKYSIDYLNFFPFLSELWRIIFLSLFFFVGASLVVLDSSWVQFLRWIWILYIALSKWWLNLCFLTCPGLLRISSNVFLKSGCSSLTGEHIGSCFFFFVNGGGKRWAIGGV